jgi:hypothetical protein
MSRLVLALSGGFIAFVVLEVPAAGQAAVEAGIGAAASSIGSSGARGVGKGIAGAFGNLNETLKSTSGAKSETPGTSRSGAKGKATGRPSSVKASAPVVVQQAPNYEDAMQIEKGIGQEELVRRFGPPAMQIASGSDEQTMSYVSSGGVVQLELHGGKVVSVVRPKPGA